MHPLCITQTILKNTLIIALLVMFAHASASARMEGEYRGYLDVPIVTGEAIHRVRSLLQEGSFDVRRIMLFGDSQESSPGGAGKVYLPRLQRKMHDRFGYVGETRLMDYSAQGSGNPPAGWLSVITVPPNGPLPTAIDPVRIPPGLAVRANIGSEVGGAQENGASFTLVHDGTLTADEFSIPGMMLDPSHAIVAEVFVFDTPNRGGVAYIERPTNDPLAWAGETARGDVELSPVVGTPEILVGRTAPLSREGKTYHRVEIIGSDPKRTVEVAGVRFVDLDRPIGITVRSFSIGGYTANRLAGEHFESGPLLRALEPHLAVLQYGANDVLETGPEGFEVRLRSAIDFIRTAMDDPCFPVVLVGDPYRWVPSKNQERQDLYPGVLEAIAHSDPAIVAFNMRRLLEEAYGWSQAYHPHLSDLVHLTPLAQKLVADQLSRLLLNDRGHGCTGDFNSDGVVNAADFGRLLANLGALDDPLLPCPTVGDMNFDGRVTSADLGLFLLRWGPCPHEFSEDGPSPSEARDGWSTQE